MESEFADSYPPTQSVDNPIKVQPHGGETPLKIILMIVGVFLWFIILMSMIGVIYALVIGIVLWFAHLRLVVHLRGSSIKLSPQQMPHLYQRVATLSQRIGLKKVPEAYLVQSGGVLNAFATKFVSRRFIAIYSDMVHACGDNVDALDFIIGHELGHLHRGHLHWRALKAPAMIIPFIGPAYYRSCEFTCDLYGKQSCADHSKCIDGLCLLAAGPHFVSKINSQEFVNQIKDLNSVFMKLGSWFESHPPLSRRAAALMPELVPMEHKENLSTLGALFIAALMIAIPLGSAVFVVPKIFETSSTYAKIQSALHKKPPVVDQTPLPPFHSIKPHNPYPFNGQ